MSGHDSIGCESLGNGGGSPERERRPAHQGTKELTITGTKHLRLQGNRKYSIFGYSGGGPAYPLGAVPPAGTLPTAAPVHRSRVFWQRPCVMTRRQRACGPYTSCWIEEHYVGMLNQLISMATKAMSGGNTNRSGNGASPSSGRSQMVQRVGSEAINQVRKAGPDAAQRHLSKTRFGTDPRARKAAKAADDLARHFAGTGASEATAEDVSRSSAPDKPVNRYGERP